MTKNPRLIDMTGKIIEDWLVLKQAGNTQKGAALWECQCRCGNKANVLGSDLRKKKSTNCGCKSKEKFINSRKTHGKTGARIYTIWKNMNQRCNNPNNTSFARYGARGIGICKEWKHFEKFLEWAEKNGYSDELSIDRIDNAGHYTPSNCRWVTPQIQSENRGKYINRAPDGELWWHKAQRNGITRAAYNWRKGQGWPMEKVVSHPLRKRRFPRKRDPSSGKFI